VRDDWHEAARVRRVRNWIVGLAVLVGTLGRRRRRREPADDERIVPPGSASPRAEGVVVLLLLAGAACAVGFIVVYALDGLRHQTQLLGLTLGLSLAAIAAALVVVARRLVVTEEIAEEYPEAEHPDERDALVEVVQESGDRLTRKRLLGAAAGAAGGALGLALLVPVASLGPALDTSAFYRTPWVRGRRLVDEQGKPLLADDVEASNFYTAYPEGADPDQMSAPVVVVRLDPSQLELPPERAGWAPDGILAYSKICTHAGCAISLYRSPLFEPVEPGAALVCPCHYSTFNPASGGVVVFGPAGRPLPQLPLAIDARRELRAAGNFSGPIGPSWWGVRKGRPT
jgi:quinol---cytochrome c reductase iron-sulfur subunit